MAEQIYVMIGEEQVGPINEEDVRARVEGGDVGPASMVWHPGMDQWKPLSEALPELLASAPAAAAEPVADVGAEQTMHMNAAQAVQMSAAEIGDAPQTVAEGTPAADTSAAVSAAPVVASATPDTLEATPAEPEQAATRAAAPAEDEPAAPKTRRWESHGTVFEVIYGDYHQMPKITISNNACVLEAGAMHYVRGQIEIEVPKASVSGFMKGALTKEAATRPIYRGTGDVFLEPTLGEVNVLELANEEWVLDRGAFLASDEGVELGVFTNKAWTGLIGGEGMFQTKVSGTGKVFFVSDGVCERLELHNERLMVDGSFAVARSAGLGFSVQKATKGLISSLRSGEGLVNIIEGTGTVLIAPIPNRSQRLFKRLDLIRAALTAGKRR